MASLRATSPRTAPAAASAGAFPKPDRQIPGCLGIDLLRQSVRHEAEFVTLRWFDSVEAVQHFAGPDYDLVIDQRE